MYRRFLSVRYFRTRLVNWLSVAGVMVGVAVMIVVWSVFSGFQVEVRKSIRGTLADIELSPDGTAAIPTEPTLAEAIGGTPDVISWSPRLTVYVAHSYKTNSMTVVTGAANAYYYMEAVGVDWRREVEGYEAAKKNGAKEPTGLPKFVVASSDRADVFHSRYVDEHFGADSNKVTGMFSKWFLDHFVGGHEKPEGYLDASIELIFVQQVQSEDDQPKYEMHVRRVVVSAVYDGKDQEADARRVFFDRATLWRESAPIPPKGAAPVVVPTPYTQVAVTVQDYERAAQVRDRMKRRLIDRKISTVPVRAEGLAAGDLATVRRRDGREVFGVVVARDGRLVVRDGDEEQRLDGDAVLSIDRHGAGFDLLTWQDQRAQLLKAVGTEKVLLAIVIAFIGLLAGFTILATLTLTVVEKTRDIGVLMALGATSRGVMSVFLRSGVLIGVLGGVLGLGLGVGLTESLEPIRAGLKSAFDVDLFPPDIYLFDKIPYVYNLEAMGYIVLGCMLVAFLAGLLPSLRAARMDPIVALRHE